LVDVGRAAAGKREESGVGTVLTAVTAVVLITIAGAGGLGLAYAATARSVRAAADLVAVSGAQAHSHGADACAEARRIAARNQVDVRDCEVTGDLIDFVVQVQVSRTVGWRLPGLPERVGSIAYAGNVIGVP
jgi:secretion/DNA translocation related TadE-like protein